MTLRTTVEPFVLVTVPGEEVQTSLPLPIAGECPLIGYVPVRTNDLKTPELFTGIHTP